MLTKSFKFGVFVALMAGASANASLVDPDWVRVGQFGDYGDSRNVIGNGNCNAVSLTKITYLDDTTNLLGGNTFNSTKCMKFKGNEDNINPNTNLGWLEMGC